MDKSTQITQAGYDKLKNELDNLIKNRRAKTVERLHKARSMGDLKENSEYAAAKEELSFIENRIIELEKIIAQAQVVNDQTSSGVIKIGSRVTVSHDATTQTIDIVGDYESDPLNNKISINSPIGKALLNKKVGDVVEIIIPAGKVIYKIITIH